MRGSDKRPGELFSYVNLEKRIRSDHPLRAIRALTDSVLAALSGDSRRSIPDWGGHRSRPRCYCGRCRCRRSTRFARSVN
jgi:hypothetical protein